MTKHRPVTLLHVDLHSGDDRVRVGRLAREAHKIFFEYDPAFVATGLELSPIKLPLSTGVKQGEVGKFEGLFGVFNDSLPDGWGRLLLDRELRRLRIDPASPTPLERLAYVGDHGMGALAYQPAYELDATVETVDLHRLAEQSARILEGESEEIVSELFKLGGSSGGARPKVLVQLRTDGRELVSGDEGLRPGFEPYLVKFGSSSDPADVGPIEHAYALMARAAGIEMEETRVIARRRGKHGFFATRRFDRRGFERRHVHSVSGLLHHDHRTPSLDYDMILRATRALTKDEREVAKMFRRMVFNVLAHNRDDHSKNFAFLMEPDGVWHLAPAFDLIFNAGPGGEHASLIAGEGKAPRLEHLEEIARRHSIEAKASLAIVDEVRSAIGSWSSFADEAKVTKKSAARIADALTTSIRSTLGR
jgi:serine/threonine-protein kinase HipA